MIVAATLGELQLVVVMNILHRGGSNRVNVVEVVILALLLANNSQVFELVVLVILVARATILARSSRGSRSNSTLQATSSTINDNSINTSK